MKRFVYFLVPLALLCLAYFFRGPYLFPASWALGPCLMDWTSPSTWSPRASPLRTLDFGPDDAEMRVCYGSPSARDRVLFGEEGIVPQERRWRMGANEPTRFFTGQPVIVGGTAVESGRYSLYAIPRDSSWSIVVNGSTWHWGNMITASVREQELFSFEVVPERAPAYSETLTFIARGGDLVMEWGDTAIRIPVETLGE